MESFTVNMDVIIYVQKQKQIKNKHNAKPIYACLFI